MRLRTFICFVLCLVLTIGICSCGCSDVVGAILQEKKIMERINSTPRSKSIVYVDSAQNIYFYSKRVSKIDEVVLILYISENSIYYVTSVGDKNVVCRAKHDYSCKEELFAYNSAVIEINMPSEGKVFYAEHHGSNESRYLLRNLESGVTEFVTKEQFERSYNENDSYSADLVKNQKYISKFVVTRKRDGEERVIDGEDMKEILKIDEGKFLSDNAGLWFSDIIFKDDKIFVVCGSSGVIAIFQYDFQTEQIEFEDWQASGNVSTGVIDDIFVF